MRTRLLLIALALIPLATKAYSSGCLAHVHVGSKVVGKLASADLKEFQLYKCEEVGIVKDIISLSDGEYVVAEHQCQGALKIREFMYDACQVREVIVATVHVDSNT